MLLKLSIWINGFYNVAQLEAKAQPSASGFSCAAAAWV